MANTKTFRYMIYILATVIILYLNVAQSDEYIRTKRRMYAMCPPSFERIGSDCYFVSKLASSWLDGHFNCKDKNSKLAEPEKVADRKLRQFLLKHDNPIEGEIWIGGSFDRINKLWQWGYTGVNITHNSFSKLDPCQSLDFQCIVLNPNLKYRWSARSCVERHRYVCQHKMPKVSEKNRFKVYNRWNQTYPNQYANEIVLEVINNPNSGSRPSSFVRPLGSNETLSIRTRHKKSKNYPSAVLPQSVEIFSSSSTQPPPQQSPIKSNLSNDINSTKNVTSEGNYGQLIVIEKSREQIMREKAIRRQRQRMNQTNRNQQIKDNDTVDKITSFDLAMARKRNAERRRLLRQQKKLKREQLKREKLAEQKRLAENEASKKRAQEEKAEIDRQHEIALRNQNNEKQELQAKQEREEKIRQHEEARQRIFEEEKIRMENENRRKSDAIKEEEERTQKLEEERQRLQQDEFERYEREEIARREKERARLEAKQKRDEEIKRLAEQERQDQEEQNRLEMAERRREEEEEQLKINERKLKAEEDRIKRERDEEKRRIKALRREKNDLELQKQLNEKKKEKTRRLQIRLSKLSESDRLAFLEHLRNKPKSAHNTKDNFANEATIPE